MGTTTDITRQREREFINYRESLIIDEQTWVAENLDTHLEKPLRYEYRDGELWSEQGQALGDVFETSVKHYRDLTLSQPEAAFQYRRSLAEQREYRHMLAMAQGNTQNTFVAVSPLPRELHGHEKSMLGYQPKRGLGFIRVITREADGSIKMWTHSIDRSDDPRVIDAIYDVVGEKVDWSHDVLEQPVALQIDDELDREILGDALLRAGDKALEASYGGSWFAGRNDRDRREAVAFVMQQTDLLYAHVDALIHVGPKSPLASKLRYDFAAAMRRRFEGNTQFSDAGDVATEMSGAGNDAAGRGETADGCGLSISATASQNLEQAGYKQAPSERIDKDGECVACLKPAKVGGCSVCQDCQDLSDRGVDLFEVREKALKRRAAVEKMRKLGQNRARVEQRSAARASKQQLAVAKYGAHARVKNVPVVGGAQTVVYDYRTNVELGVL